MTKRKIMLITVCFAIFAISLLLSRQFFKSAGKRNMDVPAAGSEQIEDSKDTEEMTELEETERTAASEGAAEPEKVENVTIGSEKYRGFILDCVLHSEQEGDIHYNVYIPDSYDGTKEYALYVTLPGYQGRRCFIIRIQKKAKNWRSACRLHWSRGSIRRITGKPRETKRITC